MTITAGAQLTWAGHQFREREALVFGDQRYSFHHVHERSNRLAHSLRGLGLEADERVAVLLHNSVASVETLFGITKAGLACVSLNARHTAPEHLAILLNSESSLVIAGAEFEEVIAPIAGDVPSLRGVIGLGWQHGSMPEYEKLLEKASSADPAYPVTRDNLIRLAYTSGTTGKSKGVVSSIGRQDARLANFFGALEYELGPAQSMVHVGPLTHAAGNYLMPYYLRGARNIVLPHFDLEMLLNSVARERVTHMLLVPTMIVRMLDELERKSWDLSSVTRINYGTAPIPLSVLKQGLDMLGPVFRQHYGMTEAPQPLTLLYPEEHKLEGPEEEVARIASCGRPTMNVAITIRDDEGGELPRGEVGEIAVRAQGVADVSYWKSPELTAELIRDGWLYSGDLGRMDDAGYLFIVGRKKDMIITGGYNVYSREVEEALFQHPGILEAAVAGIPDKEWGESICAFVVPKDGQQLQAQEVIEHTRSLIASYKKPRYVTFLAALPKNHAGKVDKNLLRAEFIEKTFGKDGASTEGVQARY